MNFKRYYRNCKNNDDKLQCILNVNNKKDVFNDNLKIVFNN